MKIEQKCYFSRVQPLHWKEPDSIPIPRGHKFYSFYKPDKNKNKLFMLTDKNIYEIKLR